jgi:sarcosine oxidase subunit delta
MLLIHCPVCAQDRPEVEFSYGGEAHIARPENPAELKDDAWKDYLFTRSNRRGLHYERWRHVHGCGRFFNAARNTVTDRFVSTYEIGQKPPEPSGPAEETT